LDFKREQESFENGSKLGDVGLEPMVVDGNLY
jgi:hypothetical protein